MRLHEPAEELLLGGAPHLADGPACQIFSAHCRGPFPQPQSGSGARCRTALLGGTMRGAGSSMCRARLHCSIRLRATMSRGCPLGCTQFHAWPQLGPKAGAGLRPGCAAINSRINAISAELTSAAIRKNNVHAPENRGKSVVTQVPGEKNFSRQPEPAGRRPPQRRGIGARWDPRSTIRAAVGRFHLPGRRGAPGGATR